MSLGRTLVTSVMSVRPIFLQLNIVVKKTTPLRTKQMFHFYDNICYNNRRGDCTPQHYIPDILKALKGNTARFLFKEFPGLKKKLWGVHLWNPSYFVASAGENTEEAVKKYIESQKEGGVHDRAGKESV